MSHDENKLADFPALRDQVEALIALMRDDAFDTMAKNGWANPASAAEYREALQLFARGKKLSAIPPSALDNGWVFESQGTNAGDEHRSIEVALWFDGEASDLFGVFRTRQDRADGIPLVHLYDLRVM